MARRGTRSSDISLFPFLSILVCVIGLLTLMIAGSALTEIEDEPDPAAVARSEEYRKLKENVASDEARIAELRDRLSSSELADAQLASARSRLEDAREKKRQREAQDARMAQSVDLQSQLEALESRLAKLKEEHSGRVALIAELDEEIEAKGRPPEAAISIRSTGTGLDMDPVFIECTDSGIVILDDEEPVRVRREDLSANAEFLAVLDEVADSPNGIVIFLLRDDGTDSYWAARGVANARGSRNGKIPVIGHGRIDLSRVKRGKRAK